MIRTEGRQYVCEFCETRWVVPSLARMCEVKCLEHVTA